MDTALWLQVSNYDLDAGAEHYNFSARLAHEQRWPMAFTAQAILEYKKFMYLAATSTAMVSPCPIVDEVWHLHLLFSASYQEFCTLLGKQVQHVPSTHDPKEADKFRQAAEQTRRLYTEAFGPVPDAIWNAHSIYDTLHCPQATRANTPLLKVCGLLALMLLLPAAYYLLAPWYVTIDNPYFLWGFGSLVLLVFVLLELYNREQLRAIVAKADPGACIHQLQAPELVYLQSGRLPLVVDGAINELLEKNVLQTTGLASLGLSGIQASAEGCSKAVLQAMPPRGTSLTYPELLRNMLEHPAFRNIRAAMEALQDHYTHSRAFRRLYIRNIIVFALLLTAGLVRLGTGLMRDKPIFFLVWCLAVLLLSANFYLNQLPRKLGRYILPQLYKQKHEVVSPADMAPDLRYFLLGAAALTTSFAPMVKYKDGHGANSSGSDSGGGGGGCGSGCGGGCGGCGGS